MKNSELAELRRLRNSLVEIGKTVVKIEDERLKDTLTGKVRDAHRLAFSLCAPYHKRALS